jgi:hypothetical protein
MGAGLSRHTDDLVSGLALRAGEILGMVVAHRRNMPDYGPTFKPAGDMAQ